MDNATIFFTKTTNRELYKYRNILEYQDFFIRINTCIGIININGFGMKMEEMTKDDIVIEGEIDSVDFEKIEE